MTATQSVSLTIEQALQQAVAFHQAGHFSAAQSLYQAILHADPAHLSAHLNLGELKMDAGQPVDGLCHLRTALETLFHQMRFAELEQIAHHLTVRYPDQGVGWKMLGIGIGQQGRPAEALPPLEQARRLLPDDAEIHCYLGFTLNQLERLSEAEPCFRRALEIWPDYADALCNLGITLLRQKRFDGAATSLCQALARNPELAAAHYHLGTLHDQIGRRHDAETGYLTALRLQPDHAHACNALGTLYMELGRLDEAGVWLAKAWDLMPRSPEIGNNLGMLMTRQHRHEAADAAFRRALEIEEAHPEIHNNRGLLLVEQQRFVEAEAAFRRALHHKADFSLAQWNLGLLLLSLGRFLEGWPFFEARYRLQKQRMTVMPTTLTMPMWRGEELTGKSLLILPEQGFGDQLQFCRYLIDLKSSGVKTVTLVCDPVLAALFASLPAVDLVVTKIEEIADARHDYWAFLLSFPLHTATTLRTIPVPIPYLRAPQDRLRAWERQLAPQRGFRVGVVWKGNPEYGSDAGRSLPGLATLAPLWSVPGVTFFSLQKGAGEEEANNPPPGQPLHPLGAAIRDFADSAAIVTQMDLVISSDTALPHLAGALGRPCWVLLSWNPDWRWLQEHADSPWYPVGMRLFRQTTPGAWCAVVEQVRRELARVTREKRRLAGGAQWA